MSLEELEQKLYSVTHADVPKHTEASLHAEISPQSVEKNLPSETWDDLTAYKKTTPSIKKRMEWRTILLIVSFSILLLGGGIFFLVVNERVNGNVKLVAYAPDEVERGVPFDVIVNVENQGDVLLQNAVLETHIPSGIIMLTSTNNEGVIISENIGNIGGGSLTKKTISLLPIGEPNTLQEIRFTLSYRTGGRGNFEAKTTSEIAIMRSAMTLHINTPEHVVNGSSFTFDVEYKNTSNFHFPDVVLSARYPQIFKFVSASFPPDAFHNVWQLGEVRAGSEGKVEITGVIEGVASTVTIPFTLAVRFSGKEYPLFETVVSVTLAPAPVGLVVSVNGTTKYTAKTSDQLKYAVHYSNLSGVALQDVIIRADLVGELFDMTELKTNGSFDSRANTITWTAAQVPELHLLDPGKEGSVNFIIQLKSKFPLRRISDKNFVVRVTAHLDSLSVPYYITAGKTSAITTLETKISGGVLLTQEGFYRDAASGIANSGTMPPRVNMPTEFTIHWAITNTGTDIENITLRAFLAPGVSWTGRVKSNIDSVPLYNERTQEVTWTIPKISAGRGIIDDDPIEGIFQIRAIPNITMVQAVIPLIKNAILSATDGFTGIALMSRTSELTTKLLSDTTLRDEDRRVIP